MADPTPDPHQVSEAESDRRVDEIVRRALAELRAIDPGCDCTVLFGVRRLLALGLDDRVILERDAGAAMDLISYLQHIQSYRRDRLGYDHATTDGPIDLRAAKEGPLVRVSVRVGNRWLDVATALKVLDPDEEPGHGGSRPS